MYTFLTLLKSSTMIISAFCCLHDGHVVKISQLVTSLFSDVFFITRADIKRDFYKSKYVYIYIYIYIYTYIHIQSCGWKY